MNWQREKEQLGKELVRLAYQCNCIETVFNTKDPEKRKNGWILKNGTNSIYLINMRNAGNSAEFTSKLGYAMGRTIEEEFSGYNPDKDVLIGVDMAGIPIASAISTAMYIKTDGRVRIKWGYTRPLPGEKIRTVDDAIKSLAELKQKKLSLGEWGSHNLIEGELLDGCNAIICDDMVTDSASKLIAREIIKYEAERRDINVQCSKIIVGTNREQGADEAVKKEGMELHYVVPMKSKGIAWLEDVMSREEYEHMKNFVNNPGLYQDIGRDPTKDKKKGQSSPLMQETLELARRL
ncbi:hypothetical protein EPN87_03465 [archaeon]|nr:MAG: hypothetical protein EPN87_03465 [archaeon]